MTEKLRADQENAKKNEIRQRFRGLMRRISFNRLWLTDTVEQKATMNVHKNIITLVRQHRKLGILTLPEKGMIRTHPSFRTVEMRKHLTNLFMGLSCFSSIPPVLRARLVAVMQFMLVGSRRTVIREGKEPMSVYFVLTGEVEMLKRRFDPITGSYTDKTIFISGPGHIVGNIAMIEGTLRKYTYITTTETQFLEIQKKDYDEILRPIMSQSWFDRKTAMQRLGYFDYFTEEQILLACKLAVLKQFDPLDTIFAEDKGPLSYVHFVLCGECMMLQCLRLGRVSSKTGRETYELIKVTKGKAASIFNEDSKTELLITGGAQKVDDAKTFIDDLLLEDDKTYAKKTQKGSESVMQKVERACLLRAQYSAENLLYTRGFDQESFDLSVEEEVEAEREFVSETGSSSISFDDDISEDAESMDAYEKMQRQNIDHYDEEMALWRNFGKSSIDKTQTKLDKAKEDAKLAREKEKEERRQKEIEKEQAKEKHRERNAMRKERLLKALEAKQNSQATSKKQYGKENASGKQKSVQVVKGYKDKQEDAASDSASEAHNAKDSDPKDADTKDKAQNATEQSTIKRASDDKVIKAKNSKPKHSLGATAKSPVIKKTMMPQETKKKPGGVGSTDPSNTTKEKKRNIKTHFVDVGSLTFGSIFGLGEHMDDRVVMARTSVQCLTLPRFWLLSREQNPGNIWNRRLIILNTSIPSREQLYENFKTSRKWESYKKRLVKSFIGSGLNHPTKTEDVPVMCRILQGEEKNEKLIKYI